VKGIKFQILILLIITVAFVSCRPKGILHSREMRKVLVDLHKTDAMLQIAGYTTINNPEARTIYYAQVLERHGITQAEFDSSLVWYTAHPQLFDKIYPKVLADLKAEEDVFLAMNSEELKLDADDGASATTKETEPEKVFTPAQLDSVLWVIQHGYPHSWKQRESRPPTPPYREGYE